MNTTTADPVAQGIPCWHFQYADYSVRVYQSLEEISEVWDSIASSNVFLSSSYLRALQDAPPHNMQFRYTMVSRGNAIVGVIYTQIDKFQARQSISYHRDDPQEQQAPGIFTRMRNAVAARIEFTTLLCGNTLVTGDHGFMFDGSVSRENQWLIVDAVLHEIVKYLRSEGIRIRLLFVKDFFDPSLRKFHMSPRTRVYHGFHAQPNMILELSNDWKSYEDYCNALSSKYRVRVRRALKKCKGVIKRELTIADLEKYKEQMCEYYHDIADNASFNLFILSPDYFVSVKRQLTDKYKVFGYFDGDKLIAFYSLMINGSEIEAHFLGYEQEVNREKQLYLNMLLDMISLGIDLRVERIIYGRTAMEIKSSVGAEPHKMQFYLQYQNAVINKFVRNVYDMLEPEVTWVQRNPFRDIDQTEA